MSAIISAIALVLVVGLVAGILLSFASKVFAVQEDQLYLDLRAELPGANCGGCGYAGCDDYAHALCNSHLAGDDSVSCTKCAVGGPDVAAKLASLMGAEAGDVEKQVSVVACNGRPENASPLYLYSDKVSSCKAAKSLYGGSKLCTYGCIGLGDCVSVCAFDAIRVIDGVATVDSTVCTSCGMCIKACPQNLISLKPISAPVIVKCSNRDAGKAAMAVCKTACIACHMCERTCRHDAIHVTKESNVAVIDYSKCIGCGACAEKCPKKCIHDMALKAKKESA